MHKTAAWPLTLLYTALVVYASLYPFAEWRDQGVEWWAFLLAPPPRYWIGQDVAINVAGYIPMGGLLALSLVRSRRSRHPLALPVLLCGLLALTMESLQSFLPQRVPSREDLILDIAGAFVGASGTLLLERWGAISRWNRVRSRWFVSDSRGGIVLLATWPAALLFPAAVPFGLGQVLERIQTALVEWQLDAPFLDWLAIDEVGLQPLLPATELVCVALGLLIPCLLGFCIIRSAARRSIFVAMVLASGVAATALSAALSWGPEHAWAWLDLPAQYGMVLGIFLALLLMWAPWRVSAALALMSLGIYLSFLNQAPESPYFAQTLQEWELGRFIRFNGLAQWLGWLWPYATLVYVFSQIWRRGGDN